MPKGDDSAAQPGDYFAGWNANHPPTSPKSLALDQKLRVEHKVPFFEPPPHAAPQHRYAQAGQSSMNATYYQPNVFYNPSINTSALFGQPNLVAPPPPQVTELQRPSLVDSAASSTPSIELIDRQVNHSPMSYDSATASPHASPSRGHKRRQDSLETDDNEESLEIPEGVERDGMIWGMRVDDYRALSARERKRVRNRISARTFRAKRKEHLSSLESTLGSKDLQVRLAQEETARLRKENDDLRRRLAKYERL